jgi:hypothetical protein
MRFPICGPFLDLAYKPLVAGQRRRSLLLLTGSVSASVANPFLISCAFLYFSPSDRSIVSFDLYVSQDTRGLYNRCCVVVMEG